MKTVLSLLLILGFNSFAAADTLADLESILPLGITKGTVVEVNPHYPHSVTMGAPCTIQSQDSDGNYSVTIASTNDFGVVIQYSLFYQADDTSSLIENPEKSGLRSFTVKDTAKVSVDGGTPERIPDQKISIDENGAVDVQNTFTCQPL